MDSENWPYSGHCPYPGHRAMSGRWPGRAMGLDPSCLLDPGEAVFLSFRERKEILSFASAHVTQSDFLPRGNDLRS